MARSISLTPAQIARAKADFGDDGASSLPNGKLPGSQDPPPGARRPSAAPQPEQYEGDDDLDDEPLRRTSASNDTGDRDEKDYAPEDGWSASDDTGSDFYDERGSSIDEFDDEELDDDDPDAAKWYEDPDTIEFAKSYGLSEDDIKDLSSREELDRFGRMYDQNLTAAGGPGYQQFQQPAPRTNNPLLPGYRPENSPQQQPEQTEQSDTPKFKKRDIAKMKEENYSEDDIMMAEQHNLIIEEREREAARRQQEDEIRKQQETDRVLIEFHQSLDGMDQNTFGRVVGKNGSVNQDLGGLHTANRQMVLSKMASMYDALEKQGQRNISVAQLAKRAVNVVFGEVGTTPRVANQTGKTREIQSQSRRRRPSGVSGRTSTRQAPPVQSDNPSDIANSPQMKKLWARFNRENNQD